MVRLDQFISGIRDGLLLQDNDFELLDYDRLGNVISVKYKGVYVIVDNGYLQWSCTVPPFTVTSDMDEIRWSKWLESMRKDVECTFGILKGRWRILKSGIRIEGVDAVDKAIKKLTLTVALTSERKLAQGRPLRHRLSFKM
jgi:hypothetical protein